MSAQPTPLSVQGAPVVFLHGVGLDHSVWNEVAASFGDSAIALDLPGHGGQPPLTREVTLKDLADDVLDRLPKGPVHMVGFSLGALVAQYISAHQADRILTLACVSSVCTRTPEEAHAVQQRLELARSNFDESMERAVERWFPESTTGNQKLRDETRRVLLANDAESYLHAYEVFATGDREIAAALAQISVPTLAITGELDSGSTPDMCYRLQRLIPDCNVQILPGVRHMLPVEAPADLTSSLRTLIQRGKP